MSFLNGLKDSIKLDSMTSKLDSAKQFMAEKQQELSDSGTFKAFKEKVGNFAPPGQLGNYFSHLFLPADRMSGTWDYVDNGPDTWVKSFPQAGGQKQSPIDIRISECTYDESLANTKFQFNYNPKDCVIVINPGFSWRVGVTKDAKSSFRISFLEDEYQLQQVHAHWSTDSHNGSEHLLSGLGYAAEVHIVHFNKKYGSFEEAVNHPDGLLVLGTFLDEGLHNDALDPLIEVLDKVSYKGETAELPNGFNALPLIPPIRDFWTYEGSLTTPPCAECVTWVVFRGTISISRQQLEKMRGLHTVGVEDAERNPLRMACNVRNPQPLNGRIVRSSFLSPKQQ